MNQVFAYMKKLYPLDDLTLKDLKGVKLVMLLALTSGQRYQALTSLRHEVKYEDNVRLLSSSFNGTYEIKPARECFFGCLCQEISPGRPMRVSTTTKLLISYVKPHRAITSNTISRWIKQVLTLSGIDATIFKARSTRAASVSKASQFLPVDAIHKNSRLVFGLCVQKVLS